MKSKIIQFWKNRGKSVNEYLEQPQSDTQAAPESPQAENPFEDLDREMQESFPELRAEARSNPAENKKKPRFQPSFLKHHGAEEVRKKSVAMNGVKQARLVAGGSVVAALLLIAIAGGQHFFPTSDDAEEVGIEEITELETKTIDAAPEEAEVAVLESQPVQPAEPIAPPAPVDTVILGEIKRGDTLANIMTAAGASQQDTYQATRSFTKVFSVRKLRPGQKTSIRLVESDEGPILSEFVLEPDLKRTIVATRQENGSYLTEVKETPLTSELVVSDGVISDSLYLAATRGGIPSRVLADLINIFSYDVDFQREIQKGDSFALMYESLKDEAGKEIETGNILVAEMTLSGKNFRYYRFKGKDDAFADYYDLKGQSVRKALLRTPVDGARISSGFGKRKHPISGFTKMHRGTDFAAPRGTPIYAAGDGVVEAAGWNGGYGKYVRIRHNSTYKTAYAHMHNIAKGVSKGKRVRQRQVIGYVGTTGRSTGNHLHFEVHRNGRQVNPLSVKLPTGKKLSKKEMVPYTTETKRLEKIYGEQKTKKASLEIESTTQTAAAQ